MSDLSIVRRREIIAALRAGTVPRRGLEQFAVGLERFEDAIDEELGRTAIGEGVFKAVRGDYGSGKTFFSRWIQHRAQQAGFATSEVQISETDTPLHRLETVYRRAMENLQTREWESGAFRILIDKWFFALEEEVLGRPEVDGNDGAAVSQAVGELLERRLAQVSATQPQFAACLRAAYTARVAADTSTEEGLLAWLMGQPNVAAGIKREAGIKGEIDHFGAGGFLRGLLELLKQTGRKGLLLVLDEVETLQRVRGDVREKGLNALRQLIDEINAGRYPGLYLLITGTPAFFDGPQGIKRLPPLAQRLHVDFDPSGQFDSSRAVQIRLYPFDQARLIDVGKRVRALYPTKHVERIGGKASDEVVEALARSVAGHLGGKVGIAPRLFLKKLVALLDQVEEHANFDPTVHWNLQIAASDMNAEERDAAGVERSVDDIKLDLGASRGEEGDGGPEQGEAG
ncbi:MAG TPA: BREX system ATP-binding protein BrxD [Polyangia bacterium]|nr:BREX system ATP-binding protein BrxD [Polyangia bacterium]